MAGLTTTVETRRFGKWLRVFAHALRGVTTETEVVHEDLCSVLTPSEFFAVVECKNRVTFSLQVLTDIVSKQSIDVYLASNMTAVLDRLSRHATDLLRRAQPSHDHLDSLVEQALSVWTLTFPWMTALSGALWSIPLTACGACLLYGAQEDLQQRTASLPHLPLKEFCQAVKESVFEIQHDHTHVRRIMPCGGFSYGSNILPLDNYHDQHR